MCRQKHFEQDNVITTTSASFVPTTNTLSSSKVLVSHVMVSDTTLPSSVFMSNGSSKSSLQSSTSAGYSCDLIPIAGGSCASLDENSLSLDETIPEQININTSKTTKLCLCVCTCCHNSIPRKMCCVIQNIQL